MASGVLGVALVLALGAGGDTKHYTPMYSSGGTASRAVKTASSPTPPPPSAPAPAPTHLHPLHAGQRFNGPWVPIRITQGIDEVQTRGPGQITPVANPDPVEPELVGNWKLVLPVLTTADDGFARVDTVRESQPLGELTIDAGGSFDWRVPAQVRSSGNLVEVTGSDVPASEHFWSFSGNGQTLVIAPGENGTLIVFDASTNAFFARAERL